MLIHRDSINISNQYFNFPSTKSISLIPWLQRERKSAVDALKKIAATLGKTGWDFNVDTCSGARGWVTPNAPKESNSSLSCNCSYSNNTVCHVKSIVLKAQNLPGSLPPEMAQLRHLEEIDFSRNYLNGTIPIERTSLPLKNLSLLGNRFSGKIPPWIGDLTNLVALVLEANQFTGHLPPELGKLFNFDKLINDNRFNGKLPEWNQNWTKLNRLEIQASGFEGPIPSEISSLKNLRDLRISDINGTMSFPQLSDLKQLRTLILRNCGVSGKILEYIGTIQFKHLDLSFNNLSGAIPTTFQNLKKTEFMFLNSNNLSGSVPDWMFDAKNMNLVGNSYKAINSSPAIACLELIQCNQRQSSLYINCGGDGVTINKKKIYEQDSDSGDASKFFLTSNRNWAFNGTGTFMDNNNDNDKYIATSSLRDNDH